MAGNDILYWDSCVFIAWLTNEDRPTGELDGIRDIVERAKGREVSIITSALTYVEVTETKVGAGVMNMFDDLFKRRNMSRPAVDMRVAKLARDLRDYYLSRTQEYSGKTLSVPDAVHLATSILYRANAFHTFDRKNRHGTLGLLPLSGNVAGHGLVISKPEIKQISLDLS